jgi:hypothetical protein
MIRLHWFRLAAFTAICFFAGSAFGADPDSPDGLVKIKSEKMDLAWLLPGADFRPYTKVIVNRTSVAFKQNWLKNYNYNAQLGDRVSQAQADKIMAAAQTNFDDIFVAAFRKAGYQVVTKAGPDVLRVNSGILDLDVNVPLGQSTGQFVWIISAGDAALIVEVRDSTTNALLGRVADRRQTQDMGRQLASTATNLADFRQLFGLWSGIVTNALAEVKAISPIPKELTPNQKL